jgi:hypothetical protein
MGHSAGVLKDKFCAQRKDKCDKDGQEYRENCKVSWTHQAHHVLCVASVTQYVAKKRGIADIVKMTDWCINTKPNMLAMPPYLGTMVKYYKQWIRDIESAKTPPFNNIPVHMCDHPSYKGEIDREMKKIADRAAKSTEQHKTASGTMKGELDSFRDKMKRELNKRGKRGDGTHNEWLKAYAGKPTDKWYLPFSMADDDDAEERSFPMRRNAAAMEKVAKLVKHLI